MPTPLQILLDPISLTVLGLYGVLIVLEALFPARPLPAVRGWKTRALIVFVLYFCGSSYLPLLWDDALAKYQRSEGIHVTRRLDSETMARLDIHERLFRPGRAARG